MCWVGWALSADEEAGRVERAAVLINLGETTSHSERLNSSLETLFQLALRLLTPSRPTERVSKRLIDRWAETEASSSRI